jgi:hypothetical protein
LVKSIDNVDDDVYLSLAYATAARLPELAHQIEIHGDTIVDDYFWLRDHMGVRLRVRDKSIE